MAKRIQGLLTDETEEFVKDLATDDLEISNETDVEVEEIDDDEPIRLQKKLDDLANFNWNATGKRDDSYTPEERAKLEGLYTNTLSTIAENEVVEGTVVNMNKREVVVNIGYKSEGVISLNEFRYNPELKPGDKVEVLVESQEDPTGQLLLSHKKARSVKSWDRVNQSLEKDEIIKGFIKCRTKGGMIVDVFGIEAFLPGSQIDVKPIRDYDVSLVKQWNSKL